MFKYWVKLASILVLATGLMKKVSLYFTAAAKQNVVQNISSKIKTYSP